MSVPTIQPGQIYPRNAAYFNAFGRAANAHDAGLLGGGGEVPRSQWEGDVRLIRNNSGEDCDAGDVLALEGVVVTPEDVAIDENFLRWGPQLVFIGKKPDLESPVALNKHVGHFAVLLDPIPDGKTGRAVFSGIVTAPIDLVYEHHPFADVAHDTRRLTSNWYGAAEILYKQEWPADSGNWFAAVRVSNFRNQILNVEIAEPYGIAYGSSGAAEVWWGGVVTDPLQTIVLSHTWLGAGTTLTAGRKMKAEYHRDTQTWEPYAGDCP